MLLSKFLAALRGGDFNRCRELVAAGVELEFVRGGETFLHAMAREGNVPACDFLLAAGAPVNNAVTGVTPLHLAAREGHLDVCRRLLLGGADLNCVNWAGPDHLHPMTPLWYAADGGHREVCRLLLDSGASAAYMPECAHKNSYTAFQHLVVSGNVEMVRWFVLDCGEDLAQRTRSGRTLSNIVGKSAGAGKAEAMKATLRSLKTELAVRDAVGNSSAASASEVGLFGAANRVGPL